MSIIVDTCSRCGLEKRRVVDRSKTYDIPPGWKHFDLNDLGPDPDNIFDLCPLCLQEWEKQFDSLLKNFIKSYPSEATA